MGTAQRSKSIHAPEFAPRVMLGAAAGARHVEFAEPDPDRRRGWRIIIADGSEARLYQADGGLSRLQLLETARNPAARQHEQALVSGRAGNKFNRNAGAYQALSAPAPARRAPAERFAKAVAEIARGSLAAGDRLALIASPRLLSLILRALPPHVRARVNRTVPRDVTHEPAAALRLRLRSVLGGSD